MIDPIGPRTTRGGEELKFDVPAFDPDCGDFQTLFFSLEGDAPPGATIDPATGEFAWTPTTEQASRDWRITVRVTDDGSPPLSSTGAFDAGPGEGSDAPKVVSYRRTASGRFEMRIENLQAGAEYVVQAAEDLGSLPEPTGWTVLRTIVAGETHVIVEDPDIASFPRRFYRVLRVAQGVDP